MTNDPNQTLLSHKLAAGPAYTLVLLALVILQSCSSPGQAGNSTSSVPTPAADVFSLCQYLGLAAPMNITAPEKDPHATPPAQSTNFTGQYPDIEFIPIYPGAAPVKSNPFRKIGPQNSLSIIAPADMTAVLHFYADALSKNNWVPTGDPLPVSGSKERGQNAIYVWNDPTNTLPWHMRLEIDMGDATGAPGAGDATSLQLIYSRFPDISKNLAVYPSASNITTTCSDTLTTQMDKGDSGYMATVKKSYTTQASPQQVIDYYNTMLPQYGWRPKSGQIGTYNGTFMSPPNNFEFLIVLATNITQTSNGETKVELTETMQTISTMPIDGPVQHETFTPTR